jgi:hypothetical protein
LLGRAEFLGEGKGLQGIVNTLLQNGTMAEVEASLTSASGAEGSGCATNSPCTYRRPC